MVWQELYFQFDVRTDGKRKFSFGDVYGNVQTILGAQRGLTKLMSPSIHNPCVSILLERSIRKVADSTAYAALFFLNFFSYDCRFSLVFLPAASQSG